VADRPTKKEQKNACEKDRKARRVNPRIVDILTDVEKRPEKKRARAEILNHLGSLVRDGGEAFALSRIGQISEF